LEVSSNWNNTIKKLDADELAIEYKEWMQERWNHPSVVIWDANNETLLAEPTIDSAIAKVRPLDLSHRSWDNSYSTNRNQL
jgi:beta-galactosidase